MQRIVASLAFCAVAISSATGWGDQIRGQYLEARSCDVYTGPCFANAELTLAGKEAVIAWKVNQGSWQGTSLDGLCVAVVLKSDGTLGDDGVFPMQTEGIDSVILVDDKATQTQQEALVGFARESASRYTANVQTVKAASMTFESDHDTGAGHFQAGKLAEIKTRSLGKQDCVCTNEMVFYQPLTDVKFANPVYSLTQSYRGEGLGGTWSLQSTRSGFLGTFGR
jgi:hypothetical protein